MRNRSRVISVTVYSRMVQIKYTRKIVNQTKEDGMEGHGVMVSMFIQRATKRG